jgi:hypothetical protein
MSIPAPQLDARLQKETQACFDYLKSQRPNATEFRRLAPNLRQTVNTACDLEGNTMLHLAALTENVELISVVVEAGADRTLQNNEQCFAFCLIRRTLTCRLPLETFKKLLFQPPETWDKNGILFAHYHDQLSFVCLEAIVNDRTDVLSETLPLLIATGIPAFSTYDGKLPISASLTSVIPKLCMAPNLIATLRHYHHLMSSTPESLDGNIGFWVMVKSVYLHPHDIGSVNTFQDFLHKYNQRKFLPVELALLHDNDQALAFLLEADATDHDQGRKAVWLSRAHLELCDSNTSRATSVFNYLLHRAAPSILSAGDCKNLCLLIQKIPAMVPYPLQQPNYFEARQCPLEPLAPDASPLHPLKAFLQRIILTYLLRTGGGQGGHGKEGVTCAITLFKQILAAETRDGVWQALANLLMFQPKESLKPDSLRTLIIRTVLSEENPDRDRCSLNPANFTPPQWPWKNVSLQTTVGLLIRIGTCPVPDDIDPSLQTLILQVVHEGTRAYLLERHRAGDDAKNTKIGVANAVERWHSLARIPLNHEAEFLRQLDHCLRLGSSNTDISHRGHLVQGMVESERICQIIRYKSKPDQTPHANLLQTLLSYYEAHHGKVSRVSLYLPWLTKKPGDPEPGNKANPSNNF